MDVDTEVVNTIVVKFGCEKYFFFTYREKIHRVILCKLFFCCSSRVYRVITSFPAKRHSSEHRIFVMQRKDASTPAVLFSDVFYFYLFDDIKEKIYKRLSHIH